jgi:aspartate ammonia-lyase
VSERRERDALGELAGPATDLAGIHTWRAEVNFTVAGRPVRPALVAAYGLVKLAALRTLRDLGHWAEAPAKAAAMEQACAELAAGALTSAVRVDALQGGAGTSTNMNVNEVLANRALQLLGAAPGDYAQVSPLDDLNRQQSTNDTYPTALRVAALGGLIELEAAVLALQEAFQVKEREFAGVVKVGRTQMQDAVLVTLGREMGAYAEAIGRDRWRLYKARERLRVVNLGGTAVGTGLGAEREYIFRVVDTLRALTGLPVARAENLIDATQNADLFAEVSGLLKTLAVDLIKIGNDLRLLASGPEAGLGELRLPARQEGSTIMPGKVNPVIPEAAVQAGLRCLGADHAITAACALGSLELNPFLPLVADELLGTIGELTRACTLLRVHCVEGLAANAERCRAQVEGGTAAATALAARIGHAEAARLAAQAVAEGRPLRALVVEAGLLSDAEFSALIAPAAVTRLGHPREEGP